ncbi:MAG: LPXTG cell wall anchor domain-containing protein [Actinomycetia bacterium]|nr:LPXTG cell wall anchor domain-containing protein [Actinomycetes bacterium]
MAQTDSPDSSVTDRLTSQVDAARGRLASAISSPGPDDWPVQAAEKVETLVGQVRDKTAGPAITAARAVVFGTVILFCALLLVILLTIGLFRLLTELSEFVFDDRSYPAYLLFGLSLVGVGLLFWRKRRPSKV